MERALKETGAKKFAIAGGVASNATLRKAMEQLCMGRGAAFYHPSPVFCTDNAAMIGAAAYNLYQAGKFSDVNLNADPSLELPYAYSMLK